jgi:hypothetical protein
MIQTGLIGFGASSRKTMCWCRKAECGPSPGLRPPSPLITRARAHSHCEWASFNTRLTIRVKEIGFIAEFHYASRSRVSALNLSRNWRQSSFPAVVRLCKSG